LLGLAGGAVLAMAGTARAAGAFPRVRLAQLRYPGRGWDARPASLEALAQEIRARTSVDVQIERAVVDMSSDALFEFPLLFMTGDREFKRPPSRDVERLRRHIGLGGTLCADSISGPKAAGFIASVRALAAALFPDAKLRPVPPESVLFRSYYRVETPAGRVSASGSVEGLSLDRRLAILLSHNDVMGALSRDAFGMWDMDVVPGGERQREQAIRFAVNVVLYALCLDYKDDQIHIEYLGRHGQPDASPEK
jgi:hypothetical protein